VQGVPTYIICSSTKFPTPQFAALVVEATGVADRDGQAVLGVLERLLNAGNAGRIAPPDTCRRPTWPRDSGLLSPLGTHVEILLDLLTSAAQYWASLDCANATPGKPIATTASRPFREVFMILSIARSIEPRRIVR